MKATHRLIQHGSELAPSTHEKTEVNDDRRVLVLWMRTEQREWSSRWSRNKHI
jgi:hypothetical protein